MQCAMLGLWARGYRTSTSLPGPHQTALQTLPLTMGLPNDVVIVLYVLRKQRNLNAHEGDPVSDAAVSECLAQAQALLAHTHQFCRPSLGGFEVLALYSEAIQKMNENPGVPELFRDILKNACLPYRDPETPKSFLKEINYFTDDHSVRLGDAVGYMPSVLGGPKSTEPNGVRSIG